MRRAALVVLFAAPGIFAVAWGTWGLVESQGVWQLDAGSPTGSTGPFLLEPGRVYQFSVHLDCFEGSNDSLAVGLFDPVSGNDPLIVSGHLGVARGCRDSFVSREVRLAAAGPYVAAWAWSGEVAARHPVLRLNAKHFTFFESVDRLTFGLGLVAASLPLSLAVSRWRRRAPGEPHWWSERTASGGARGAPPAAGEFKDKNGGAGAGHGSGADDRELLDRPDRGGRIAPDPGVPVEAHDDSKRASGEQAESKSRKPPPPRHRG